MKMTININDYVWVQLTDIGKQVYYDFYDYYDRLSMSSFGAPELKEDKDGYSAFQIWEFMQIFGPKTYMGMVGTPIKNNNIQFRGDTDVRKI